MTTVQLAKWARAQVSAQPWQEDWDDGGVETRSVFLGTVMALDPCGNYHYPWQVEHAAKQRCHDYWESLERQLGQRGLTLQSGEGEPTQQFAIEWRDKEGVRA